ncbi:MULTISPECIES: multidrug effflux MFS transporter [Desulfitobacterium]|uniref:Bcr/CflA family efflux transporter n=1 Tax=Desulfitobacterium dehalogenans (strain ATCC 51507 / DSM 9161 / JW/IU-DC1) TaxID=756499 RepID=I4A8C3_DESDJ|nr:MULTISPECIES: multidrug effflux MFS transporter [Desulfitobacterium]AFM00208.1 drug resistance transporter, Bcr/CflA subfamily [Desulfitobacterium dehalogenans ATCC 51507]
MQGIIERQQEGMGQKHLGRKGLIAFIVLMNMFIPLSMDLYLPALPTMNEYFGSSAAITNLTLSLFFLFYAAGILVWGPLSDRYGRKVIIMMGSAIYIASSIACALSPSITFLIISRACQGIGSGGITSASMAIVKDCFTGKNRETILAITQSISGLAPMLAPIVGAWILYFTDWRGSFWLLALISIINLVLTILYKETLREEERYRGSLLGSWSRLVVVARNKSFIIPALIFAFGSIHFMGYIAVSSYVYIDYFGLSEQMYSYFFAANALISILGPAIYIRYFINFNKRALAVLCFGVAALSGVLIMTLGQLSPFIFLVGIILMSLTGTVMRPFSTNILMEQQKGDAGSMSSIINMSFTLFGSLGMAIASISWGNIVVGLGALIAIGSGISILAWYAFMKSSIPCAGVKDSQ